MPQKTRIYYNVKGMIPMRNFLKKALCLCLCFCLCMSLGACYSEDNTWAAKHGDDVMPIGAYIYYLSSAYTDAGNRVSANDKILSASIDGQSAKDWMKDRALSYIGAYYYVCDQFDELGLSLTDEDLASIDSSANTFWGYYKTGMENMGISQESFKKAFAEYNIRAQMVMNATYGKGGAQEIPESELRGYYTDTYDYYTYMYVSKSKSDENNNSVAITDEEKDEMLKNLNDLCGDINGGEITFAEAHNNYSYAEMATPTYEAPATVKKENVHENIAKELPGMKDNEAKVVEVETGVYLLQKLSLEEYLDNVMADEDQRKALLSEYKGTEFSEELLEKGKALSGVEVNQAAIKKISADKVVTNKDQTGASVAPVSSEEADGASSAGEE